MNEGLIHAIVNLKILDERANFYAERSIAENTRRAYERDWTHFFDFCNDRDLTPLPATPQTVSIYLSHLADSGISTATIARRSTSISIIHQAANEPSPCKSPDVARVIQGIRREIGKPQRKARPISWDELKRMVAKCDSSIIGRRDASLLLIGWCSALRRSELVSLNIGDLNFSEHGLLITVRRSKGDQAGKGITIGIPPGLSQFCPVKVLNEWLHRRFDNARENFLSEQPVFTSISASGKRLWWQESKKRLSDRMVSLIVKRYANFAGIPTRSVSAHSLRRGFATECGARQIPERLIARHTRHKSMEVLRGYIEDGSVWLENPLPIIYGSDDPKSSPITQQSSMPRTIPSERIF
jgi:site-specific recombinase XerD